MHAHVERSTASPMASGQSPFDFTAISLADFDMADFGAAVSDHAALEDASRHHQQAQAAHTRVSPLGSNASNAATGVSSSSSAELFLHDFELEPSAMDAAEDSTTDTGVESSAGAAAANNSESPLEPASSRFAFDLDGSASYHQQQPLAHRYSQQAQLHHPRHHASSSHPSRQPSPRDASTPGSPSSSAAGGFAAAGSSAIAPPAARSVSEDADIGSYIDALNASLLAGTPPPPQPSSIPNGGGGGGLLQQAQAAAAAIGSPIDLQALLAALAGAGSPLVSASSPGQHSGSQQHQQQLQFQQQQQQQHLLQQQLLQTVAGPLAASGTQGGGGMTESTVAALQRLQQLQQLQQFQSQFIQQQLDQLTRQAADKHQHQQQAAYTHQSPHLNGQAPSGSPSPFQIQQQQHFRSQSLSSMEMPGHLMQKGLPTPAASTELFATLHQEMVSPMYLPSSNDGNTAVGLGAGGYRDSQEYDADGNLLFTPLMSPAPSSSCHPTPGSTFQPVNSQIPTSDFFTPLTSPALGPIHHHHQNFHHSYQQQQGPSAYHHPPSMSPQLLAQTGSPYAPAGPSSSGNSPAVIAKRSSSGSGRNRSSREPKARPSPLLKPVNGSGPSSLGSRRPGAKRDATAATIASPTAAQLIMSPQVSGLEGIGEMKISPASSGSPAFSGSEFGGGAAGMRRSVSGPGGGGTASSVHPSSSLGAVYPSTTTPPAGTSPTSTSSLSPVDLASRAAPITRHQPPPSPPALASSSANSSSTITRNVSPQTPATFLNLARPMSAANRASAASSAAPLNPSPLSSPFIRAAAGEENDEEDHGMDDESGGLLGEPALPPPPPPPAPAPPVLSTTTTRKPPAAGTAAARANGKAPSSAATRSPVVGPIGGRPRAASAAKGGTSAAATTPAAAAKRGKTAAASVSGNGTFKVPEVKKTSHKAAEQKRRDSLKAGFDELRVLLPPINVEAFDPDTGEPIAGASMPRLPARSPLIPDDNPNRGVSKVALLRCSNKHLGVLNARIERRDAYVERLREEIRALRFGDASVQEDGDVLEYDVDWPERDDDEEEEAGNEEEGEDADMDGEAASFSLAATALGRRSSLGSSVVPSKQRRRSSTAGNDTMPPPSSNPPPGPPARALSGRAAARVASTRMREDTSRDERDDDDDDRTEADEMMADGVTA